MNKRHAAALADHCRLAFETGHPRYAFVDPVDPRVGVVLSVNSGWE
jgi:hypothetical protein